MGMALKGMRCVNKPPPQGLADTGNSKRIVSTNWVTCLYLHLLSTHMSILIGLHTPSKRGHAHAHGAWQKLLLYVADARAADMCWDQFTKTSAGVCQRYGDKCFVKTSGRLLCPKCKITFHPVCVVRVDKIKNAFCPCHLEGVTFGVS